MHFALRNGYSALCLFDQTHLGDFHLFVYRFAHVVNREQCGSDTSERIHFNSSLRNSSSTALYLGMMIRCRDVDFDFA